MSAIDRIREIYGTTNSEELPALMDGMLEIVLSEIGNQAEQLAAGLRSGLDEVDFDELMAWLETDDKADAEG